MHSIFATMTTIVYGVLTASYVLGWLRETALQDRLPLHIARLWHRVHIVEQAFFKPIVLVLLSILGFVLLSITGALGGAIVYGPDIDPAVRMMYNIVMSL